MSPIACLTITRLLLITAISVFMSGCGVTLSPVKREPVQIFPLETSLVPNFQTILVRFESTLPGKPLAETVWDNASGAFADAEESEQIGYTEDYSKLIPAAAAGSILGGAIGGAVVGASSGTQPDYTRIVIPFGRIFEGVFQSGLQRVFPNSSACFDDSCESETLQSANVKYVVRLTVTEFQVWENPLNHINLKATVECKVYRAGRTDQPEYVYEARNQATNQSIGSIMTPSSGFICAMNKISNEFAATLSEDVLENLQKKLNE
jgi:hypothetical protein